MLSLLAHVCVPQLPSGYVGRAKENKGAAGDYLRIITLYWLACNTSTVAGAAPSLAR